MTQQASVVTEEMRKAIGVESEPVVNEVERGAIVKFAQAIGDANALYQDDVEARKSHYGGIIAPPTFFRSLRAGSARVDVQSPHNRNLDGGSEWEFFEPVRPGDRITVTNYLADIFERQGRLGLMLFMVRETKYVNQLGQVVALQRSTSISY